MTDKEITVEELLKAGLWQFVPKKTLEKIAFKRFMLKVLAPLPPQNGADK
jgi:hypothetical protein